MPLSQQFKKELQHRGVLGMQIHWNPLLIKCEQIVLKKNLNCFLINKILRIMADQLSLRLINWIKAQMYSEHAFPVKWFKKKLKMKVWPPEWILFLLDWF